MAGIQHGLYGDPISIRFYLLVDFLFSIVVVVFLVLLLYLTLKNLGDSSRV